MSNITVIIHTPQELNHSSYIQTGLFELAHAGLIHVKVKISIKKNRGVFFIDKDGNVLVDNRTFPKASYYTLIDSSTNKKISFATDLYDSASYFSKYALENCDFYFKRNYEDRYVDLLGEKANAKIYKLGMTFGTHSEYKKSNLKFFIGLFSSNLLTNIKWDRHVIKRLAKTYRYQKRHWQFINTTRKIGRFEALNERTRDTILFQTRCFLHEDNTDVKEIHQQRYRLIKLLRREFPERFLGGFVPSEVAKKKYKDALTNVPTAPEEYLNGVKKAGIVIYTRGLANSPAWKMAEYLSQGKVIVAEPLTAELPVPLIDGKELLYFRNDEELIEKIKLVSEDDPFATRLSQNARVYFEKHVHPVQNVKRILELMLNKPLD